MIVWWLQKPKVLVCSGCSGEGDDDNNTGRGGNSGKSDAHRVVVVTV